MTSVASFEEFAVRVRPSLSRALAGHMSREDAADAFSEAMTHAWEHRARVLVMEFPVAYLFRVGRSKSRQRMQGFLPWSGDDDVPDPEPGLTPALSRLPRMQLSSVWLVHACGWSHAEAADALEVTPSTIATHASRGLSALRGHLGVKIDE